MNIEIHIAPTDAGTWVAATAQSPYFCFVAESQDAIEEIAKQAVRFYANSRIGLARS